MTNYREVKVIVPVTMLSADDVARLIERAKRHAGEYLGPRWSAWRMSAMTGVAGTKSR